MQRRPLGRTGLQLGPIGFGAFKIGRNRNAKYPQHYELPDEDSVAQLLNELLDAGVNYIDTAPAYGLSEERIGRAIAHRRHEFVLSTKVGETFANGTSTYDFSRQAIRDSVGRSLQRLRRETIDLVFLHSPGDDLHLLDHTAAVETLVELKAAGTVTAIGLSGKTVEGARRSLDWADALMVEYHVNDTSHSAVVAAAAERGVGVIVKKGLASGRLPAAEAIRFILQNTAVTSVVVGSLNVEHIRSNIAAAKLRV